MTYWYFLENIKYNHLQIYVIIIKKKIKEVSEVEGDFELTIIKQDNKYMLIILFQDSSKSEFKEFSNYKKLLKFLKMFFKNSIDFQEAIKLLEDFKLKIEGSE